MPMAPTCIATGCRMPAAKRGDGVPACEKQLADLLLCMP
jgi:hypothetical protein